MRGLGRGNIPGLMDIHCHILYGVDDGARNVRVTRKMLEMAWEDGIRAMIATPHYRPDRWPVSWEQREAALAKTRRLAQELDPDFRIYTGNEIFYREDAAARLAEGAAATLADSRYVLVEFHPQDSYEYLRQGLQSLRMEGYEVILAHWERYECLLQEPERLEELAGSGIGIQSNADAVLGDRGRAVKKRTRDMLEAGLVPYVATDCHGIQGRTPQLRGAYEYIRKKVGEETAYRVCVENPRKIIESASQGNPL